MHHAANLANQSNQPSDSNQSLPSQQSILVVDDDEAIQHALSLILEEGGYTTRTAGNGRKAIELAEQDPPHLLITDLVMPSLDGWEVVVELRRRGIHIPVILISGRAQKATNQGVYFLAKPIDPDHLLDTISEILQTHADEP